MLNDVTSKNFSFLRVNDDGILDPIKGVGPGLQGNRTMGELDKKNAGMVTCRNQQKGGKVAILWNQQVQSDRTVPNNKPDIITRDNGKGNMYVNRRCNLRRQKCD